MKRILVVANRTLCEPHLLEELDRRMAEDDISVHLLVPASHPPGLWADGEPERAAADRLLQMQHALAERGIDATGEVGDASPVVAVDDLVRHASFDEVVVSTLPAGISQWLARSAVRRIAAHTGLPTTHVVASRTPAAV